MCRASAHAYTGGKTVSTGARTVSTSCSSGTIWRRSAVISTAPPSGPGRARSRRGTTPQACLATHRAPPSCAHGPHTVSSAAAMERLAVKVAHLLKCALQSGRSVQAGPRWTGAAGGRGLGRAGTPAVVRWPGGSFQCATGGLTRPTPANPRGPGQRRNAPPPRSLATLPDPKYARSAPSPSNLFGFRRGAYQS